MSRTRRYLVNISLNYVGTTLVMLTSFWLQRFLVGYLGSSTYGTWQIGNQVLMYLGLLEFGLMGVLTRETAYATGRAGDWKSADDLPLILGQNLRLVLWQLPLVILISFGVWWFLPAAWAELQTPLGWTLLGFVVLYPFRFLVAVLQGLQDFTFAGHTHIVAWIVATSATVAVVLHGGGLYGLTAYWLTLLTLPVLAGVARLWFAFPGVLPRRLPPLEWSVAKEYFTKGLWVAAIQLAEMLAKGTDLLIIGRVLNPATVTPYSLTGKVLSVADYQVPALVKAAGPALSELKASGEHERLGRVCSALTQGMLLLTGVVVCGVVALNEGFVTWWVGAHNYGGAALTALMASSLVLRHLSFTAQFVLFCFGHERRVALVMLADGAVTATASLVLVTLFGPLGAPLASNLGVCLVSLPLGLTALAREMGVPVGQLLGALWPWLWRMLGLLAGCAVLASVWLPASLGELVAGGTLVVAVYALVMIPVALRPPLSEYVRPRLACLWERWRKQSDAVE